MNTLALQVLPQGKTWDGHTTSYRINHALICPPIQMNTTTCTNRANTLDSWDGHKTSYQINNALICPPIQMNTTALQVLPQGKTWDGHTASYRINHALICPSLDQPLRYHSICDFHEASDVCTYHVVHPVAFFCAELYRRVVGVRMNVHHDSMEFFVNLLGRP